MSSQGCPNQNAAAAPGERDKAFLLCDMSLFLISRMHFFPPSLKKQSERNHLSPLVHFKHKRSDPELFLAEQASPGFLPSLKKSDKPALLQVGHTLCLESAKAELNLV